MGDSKKELLWRVKSSAAYYFIDRYNLMEQLVINLFQETVKNASDDAKKRVYFLAGSQGKTRINVNGQKMSIEMNPVYFNYEKSLTNFNLSQIVKMNDAMGIMPVFDVEIDLLQQRMLTVKVSSCINTLGIMRNKLVHKTESAEFKSGDIIEQLSIKYLERSSLSQLINGTADVLDGITIAILSNAVYQDMIINKLVEESSKL